MDSELIDRIVREVIARMQAEKRAEKPQTLVIAPAQVPDPQAAGEALLKHFTGIRVASLQEGFGCSGIETLVGDALLEKNLLAAARESEHIVLAAPALWMMEKIAQGEDSGFVEYLVLRSLLWGKKVHLLLDYKLPQHRKNPFFAKIAEVSDSLRGMGIDLMQYGCEEEKPGTLSLVTEKEVAQAHAMGQSRIACTAGAIVTPAARDRAQELHIKIDR